LLTANVQALQEIGFKKAIKYVIYTLLLIPYRWSLFPPLRAVYLRLLGAHIGRQTVIHDVHFFNLYRTGLRGLTVSDKCFIGDECLIDLADRVELAEEVTLAERVTILTHTNVGYADHPLQPFFPSFSAPVRLKRGAFIGANVTLLPGVTVGECAFVAAGSVVNHDVEAYTVVAGVPAKVIRRLR
jgi:acetyltransferase-like isoleucine patch superfamily enzyme